MTPIDSAEYICEGNLVFSGDEKQTDILFTYQVNLCYNTAKVISLQFCLHGVFEI